MPANKRQHYVPQFLLRQFAGAGGGAIGIWTLAAGRFVSNGKLSRQAAKPWYYGEDGEAERHFGQIEAKAATAIRRMIETGRPPPRLREGHHALVYFMMLQFGRTPAAVDTTNRTLDAIARSLIRQQEPSPEILNALDRVKISDANALHRSLRQALMGAPAIYDLDFKLMLNISQTPFVLSDNPVTLFNSFLTGGENLNTTGLGAVGLQIWLPVSPAHGLLFYDSEVYRVGRGDSRVVRVVGGAQAESFNRLTWAGAHEVVFTRPNADRETMARAAAAAAADREPIREWIAATEIERTETSKRVRTEYHRVAPALGLDLPFIRNRLESMDLSGVREAPMRRPDFMVDLMAWGQAVRAGEMDLETYRRLTNPVPPVRR